MLKLIVFVVFILPLVYGCPSAQKLLPCKCTEFSKQEKITCPGLLNEQTLIDVMHAFQINKNFYSFTIENSNFRFLPHDIFKSIQFQEFQLVNSTFMSLTDTEVAFEGLEDSLASLVITDSTILSTWDWSVLKNLKKLMKLVIEADLITISEDIAQLQSDLLEVSFANNDISYVHDTAFSSFKNLMGLTLSNNQIEELKRSMMPNPAPRLWKLDFSQNKIQQLPMDLFENMPRLMTLILNSNKLLTLSEKPFKDAWISNLNTFEAMNNPLRCDCRMIWLTKLRRPNHVTAVCDQPLNMRGRSLLHLTEKDLWC